MTTDADLYALAERLFPLPRTVQGHAVLATLDLIEEFIGPTHQPIPGVAYFARRLDRTEVPVGTKVFDWEVLPDAKNRRHYHPTLDELPAYDGPLTYAECVIPGRESKEVLLSTYTCHPSLANDNVSGMVVTAALAKWLASEPRRFTYRVLFAPETIGALCWLAQQPRAPVGWYGDRNELQVRIIAGYTINCCGDERAWSFIPSRKGNTLADRAARHVLSQPRESLAPGCVQLRRYDEYTFADRGSDERQFCAPGVDLPVASVMRSKHGTFPEYHTPADDLSVISAKGLGDSFRCYQRIIETIEANRTYHVTTVGEPMLSKRGLYPSGTVAGPNSEAILARNICACADGQTDLLATSEFAARPMWEVAAVAEKLVEAGLLREC